MKDGCLNLELLGQLGTLEKDGCLNLAFVGKIDERWMSQLVL
jgi:hypothetical protein